MTLILAKPTGGGGTDANDAVKVSSNDTTSGFLNGKLVAGTNITLTENTDGGNETLTIASTGSGSITNNYTDGLKDDQEFTPSANAASEVFTLSGTQEAVRVYLNGSALAASEWSQSGANLTVTPLAGLETTDTVKAVQRAQNFSGEQFVMSQTSAPSPANGTAIAWVASGSGTKDGTAYEEGDYLVTSVNQAGLSKTLLIMDHSTA